MNELPAESIAQLANNVAQLSLQLTDAIQRITVLEQENRQIKGFLTQASTRSQPVYTLDGS